MPVFRWFLFDPAEMADSTIVRIVCKICSGNSGNRSSIVDADTILSKTVFGLPSGEKIEREVKATYTQNGSKLDMQWAGAGNTEGTIHGDIITMINEGMAFVYEKNPE